MFKKLSFANLKATLLTYFDTLYTRTTAIFGIGQTWQDVKASRNFATTYTNTTGKPIQVSMCPVTAGNTAWGISLSVDNIIVSQAGGYTSIDTKMSSCAAIVPDGSTYRCDIITGSPVFTGFKFWSELR